MPPDRPSTSRLPITMRVVPPEIFGTTGSRACPGIALSELSCPSESSPSAEVVNHWLRSPRPWPWASRPDLRRISPAEAARGQVQAVFILSWTLLSPSALAACTFRSTFRRVAAGAPQRNHRPCHVFQSRFDHSWASSPLRRFRCPQFPYRTTTRGLSSWKTTPIVFGFRLRRFYDLDGLILGDPAGIFQPVTPVGLHPTEASPGSHQRRG